MRSRSTSANRNGCNALLIEARVINSSGFGSSSLARWVVAHFDRRVLRIEIVNGLRHVDARNTVDTRVMYFADDRVAVFRQTGNVLETFDHREFPQRLRQVERTRMQTRRLNAQLAPVTRLRQANVANVKLEIEVFVFDPIRMVEAERNVHELLANVRAPCSQLSMCRKNRFEALHAARQRSLIVNLDTADVPSACAAFRNTETTRPLR